MFEKLARLGGPGIEVGEGVLSFDFGFGCESFGAAFHFVAKPFKFGFQLEDGSARLLFGGARVERSRVEPALWSGGQGGLALGVGLGASETGRERSGSGKGGSVVGHTLGETVSTGAARGCWARAGGSSRVRRKSRTGRTARRRRNGAPGGLPGTGETASWPVADVRGDDLAVEFANPGLGKRSQGRAGETEPGPIIWSLVGVRFFRCRRGRAESGAPREGSRP